MNLEKIAFSLLSFGETGMELIVSQEVEGIDADHVGMIGNFYSNVLGAAEQTTGLFGPLPIAYRYDLLLFVYAFNAYDPNLKDERVIRNNNITRSSLLLFFPTSFDTVFSNQRKTLNTIIDRWSKPYLELDIRKVSVDKLNQLKENLLAHIISVTTKLDFYNQELSGIVKVIGKNFFLLETVGFLFQKNISLKFLTNSDKLEPILKRSILYENIDSLINYSNSNKNLQFQLTNTKIEIININLAPNNFSHWLKGIDNGVFLFYDFNQNAANSNSFIDTAKKTLNYSPKNTKLTYCIENDSSNTFKFEDSEISSLLANQIERSISLVDLNSKKSSLAVVIIEFLEKIISNY